MLASTLSLSLALAATTLAHTGAFGPGMYCRNGNKAGEINQNTNTVVDPVYKKSKTDWWFQHDRGCDAFPPPAGEFLELPANGAFTVELAHNRAFTTLSYDGKFVTAWPDGKEHPEDWNGWTGEGEGCIQDDGALHVQNETSATGTAFAIAYEPDMAKIKMEDLTVFAVAEHTPWKRLTTYQVPDLPACPPGGCTCAWLWVPRGCGEPNMYMQGFKCTVTGATATHAIAPAVPAVYCKDDPSKCVKGAKQMIVFNQAEGDNVPVPREARSPGYNVECGFLPGAQKDIFVGGGQVPQPPISSPAPVAPPASSSLSVRAAASVAPPASAAPPASVAAPASSAPSVRAAASASAIAPPVDVALPSTKRFIASTFSRRVRPTRTAAPSPSTLVQPAQTSAAGPAPGNSCNRK